MGIQTNKFADSNTETKFFTRTIYSGQNAKARVVSTLHENKSGLSLKDLARATGVEEATVRRHLTRLTGEGVLKRFDSSITVKRKSVHNPVAKRKRISKWKIA